MVDCNWSFWPPATIIQNLTDILTTVESKLDTFSDEHRAKNLLAMEYLRANPPSAETIAASRGPLGNLLVLAFALDDLGRRAAGDGDIDRAMWCFRRAHELFRGGQPQAQPTQWMRLTLLNAIKALVAARMEEIGQGKSDLSSLDAELQGLVTSAWGRVPPALGLTINELLVTGMDRARRQCAGDTFAEDQLVRRNAEALLGLQTPPHLMSIAKTWSDHALHVCSTVIASLKERVPQPLSTVISIEAWDSLRKATGRSGSADLLRDVLSEVEEDLEVNLLLRVTIQAEFREPERQLRHFGGPDHFFDEAYSLLRNRDSRALDKFKSIYFHKSNNPIAREWYAYAMACFSLEEHIWDIIDVLRETLSLANFDEERQWTARWNLACALSQRSGGTNDALDSLLPALENDQHPPEVFRLCLQWALQLNRDDILPELLRRSTLNEAQLLSALYEMRATGGHLARKSLEEHFRRINHVVVDPDRGFPPPEQVLREPELDDLVNSLSTRALVEAGIEWFRQRISSSPEQYRFFKNWDCAARLHEEVARRASPGGERERSLASAWRCHKQAALCGIKNPRVRGDVKLKNLERLVIWAERNGHVNETLQFLRSVVDTPGLDGTRLTYLISRLAPHPPAVPPAPLPQTLSPTANGGSLPGERPTTPPRMSLAEADAILVDSGNLFIDYSGIEDLQAKVEPALRLVAAVHVKEPSTSEEACERLEDLLRLVAETGRGVPPTRAAEIAASMKAQLTMLQQQSGLRLELGLLVKCLDSFANQLGAAVRTAPAPGVTPPSDLGCTLPSIKPGMLLATRIGSRLRNSSEQPFTNIEVRFSTPVEGLTLGPPARLGRLQPGATAVVECTADIGIEISDDVDLEVHLRYTQGAFSRTSVVRCKIPVARVARRIPVELRFTTGAAVPADRTDLFHGRDRELSELAEAFAGGRLRRLYYVSGIRRVGKTTLMKHLGRRCEPEVLPLLIDFEKILSEKPLPIAQLVSSVIDEILQQLQRVADLEKLSLNPPTQAAIADLVQIGKPWRGLEEFLQTLLREARTLRPALANILLCFDELQWLVRRIQENPDTIGTSFLAWLRELATSMGSTLAICTGSEPYELVHSKVASGLWGQMPPYDVSFVDRQSTERIACEPVKDDGVIWLQEALDAIWDMTEGHPWIIQILAEKAMQQLNREQRRVVLPGDVERAAEEAIKDPRTTGYWWNVRDGMVTEVHRQIAFIVLQHQPSSRQGLPLRDLDTFARKAGLRNVATRVDEMTKLQLLSVEDPQRDYRLRIRGAFLERHLEQLMKTPVETQPANQVGEPLALFLDWENVKQGLLEVISRIPARSARTQQEALEPERLGRALLQAASRHGQPRQRWAVASWDRQLFEHDQRALTRAGYFTAMAGSDKPNASDHVLIDKIYEVLRNDPGARTFIIATGDGDFAQVIQTLQREGRTVVLWATKSSINRVYPTRLSDPNPIQIEWLEELAFQVPSDQVAGDAVSDHDHATRRILEVVLLAGQTYPEIVGEYGRQLDEGAIRSAVRAGLDPAALPPISWDSSARPEQLRAYLDALTREMGRER